MIGFERLVRDPDRHPASGGIEYTRLVLSMTSAARAPPAVFEHVDRAGEVVLDELTAGGPAIDAGQDAGICRRVDHGIDAGQASKSDASSGCRHAGRGRRAVAAPCDSARCPGG